MNTKEIFGENLKYFRKQKQITQEIEVLFFYKTIDKEPLSSMLLS